MSRHKKIFKITTKWLLGLYILSFIIISLVGGYLGIRGHQVPYTHFPNQQYEEVSFPTFARDNLTLGGWFFPADSDQVVVIVHGWGGNRARLLNLAQYLQRQNLNVLTFDLRGGTGRNTYGQRESLDVAGAIDWLKTGKQFQSKNITLVGASMGALAVIDYASKHEVGKLVLISPIIDVGSTKYVVLKDRHFLFPSVYAFGATLVERFIFGVKSINAEKQLQAITIPIFILHTTGDELSPIGQINKLQQDVATHYQTNITVEIIPGSYHNFMDQDPDHNYFYSQQIAHFILQ